MDSDAQPRSGGMQFAAERRAGIDRRWLDAFTHGAAEHNRYTGQERRRNERRQTALLARLWQMRSWL